MIKLNKLSRKLLLLQRNELLTNRQKWLRKKFGRFIFTNLLINFFQDANLETSVEELFIKEIMTFKKFLPNSIKNVMDVGCGLGLINIYINRIANSDTQFFLLDKNRIDKKIKYGFSPNYESYNNLNETRKILMSNNIKDDCIKLFDVDQKILIHNKIDLVISLKSMGYHYPIDNYIDLFRKCCTKDTVFIYDIGENQFDENTLKEIFNDIEIIYEEKTNNHLRRIRCTNFKY